MYWFKHEFTEEIFQGRFKSYFAKKVGLSNSMFYQITNGSIPTKKTTAYAITKALNKDAEILDYFIRKER